MPRGDAARRKEPFHLLAHRTRRRHVQDVQQVVTKELVAPYTVKYLPDTRRIVLTAATRVVRAVPPEPTMEERLIMAVWGIWSLYLSRTKARYPVGSMTCGFGMATAVWQKFGSWLYRSPGCSLPIGETTRPSMVRPATYLTASATCTSVDHPHPRTSCSPGTDGCIGCLSRWMLHRGMRPRMSIARLLAPPAPTNYLVGGYQGAVSFKDTEGNDRPSLFFLCGVREAPVLMAGCQV